MSRALVQNFAVSLDGFGTGEGQTREAPFGLAGDRLHEGMVATRWRAGEDPGGTGGLEDGFARRLDVGSGAEIMGAGKSGHPGWREDRDWKGAWGPTPP